MEKTRDMVRAAMLATLTCIATMIIKIPSPLHGYINLGDSIVLLAGWRLPGTYGFLAAGIGSALADLFSGYVAYAPVTFEIKGVMALTVGYMFTHLKKSVGDTGARISGGVTAEMIMVAGYLIFESVLYGLGPSLANIPANAVMQGISGMITGVMLVKIFDKNKIFS